MWEIQDDTSVNNFYDREEIILLPDPFKCRAHILIFKIPKHVEFPVHRTTSVSYHNESCKL